MIRARQMAKGHGIGACLRAAEGQLEVAQGFLEVAARISRGDLREDIADLHERVATIRGDSSQLAWQAEQPPLL